VDILSSLPRIRLNLNRAYHIDRFPQ
jgi:hypothetical protein